MAKNTGRGTRNAEAAAQRETNGRESNGLWARRDMSTGRFTEAKRTGGSFKGTRRSG